MSMYRLKGASGPVINRAFPLSDRTVIGTDVSCAIRVEGPGIGAKHAELVLEPDGGVTLRHLEPGLETQCNGEAVEEKRLSSGDEIRIGPCRWLLQAPGLRPERVLAPESPRPARRIWPWLLPVGLVLAGWLAWTNGWLPF